MGGIGSGNCLKEQKEAGVSGGILQYQAWAWLGMLRTLWVLVPGEGEPWCSRAGGRGWSIGARVSGERWGGSWGQFIRTHLVVAQRIDSGGGEGSRELRCHGELAEPSVRKGEPSWLVLICCDWSSAASVQLPLPAQG